MKQQISPKILVAVIAVVVLLIAGGMIWVWRAPTANVAATPGADSGASPGRTLAETQAMAQGRRQEMLSRRQHQGAGNADNGSAQSGGSQ